MKIENLKLGDILLWAPNDWLGKAIVAITGSKVSHSGIYCGKMIDNEPDIVHSFINGIVYEKLVDYATNKKKYLCYVRRHSTETDFEPVLSACNKYVSEKNPYPFGNKGCIKQCHFL